MDLIFPYIHPMESLYKLQQIQHQQLILLEPHTLHPRLQSLKRPQLPRQTMKMNLDQKDLDSFIVVYRLAALYYLCYLCN